jgi:hypothetical protein
MSGCKYNISLSIVLGLLFSVQAFSQEISFRDNPAAYNSQEVNLKPGLHYTVGSNFLFIPRLGAVSGFTLSPCLSIPLTPKLSVDGGIIAGRYYSTFRNLNPEDALNGAFNELSVYGSAIYHVNSQLTVYGTGLKQLSNTSPFSYLPKSSYAIGSTYNFGSFSIGVTVQMSKWSDNINLLPFNGTQGFYSPYEQIPGIATPFGR